MQLKARAEVVPPEQPVFGFVFSPVSVAEVRVKPVALINSYQSFCAFQFIGTVTSEIGK